MKKYSGGTGCGGGGGGGGGRASRIDIFMSHAVILTLIWLKRNVERKKNQKKLEVGGASGLLLRADYGPLPRNARG